MAGTPHDPIDHARTTRLRAGAAMKDTAQMAPLLLIGIGVVAFAICIACFAFGQTGVGIAAAIVALLAAGAGLAWFGMERRRIRELERYGTAANRDAAR